MLSAPSSWLARFMKYACTPQASMISSASANQPSPLAPSPPNDRSSIGSASSASAMPSAPSLVVRSCSSANDSRSEEHTSELQSRENLVCRLLLEKKKSPQNARHVLLAR